MQTPHVVRQGMQPFTETVQVARWKLAVYGALCYYNSCDSWPSQLNGGKKKKRNNRTFTKASANVKSLLTLLPCSSQVCQVIEKKKASLFKPVSEIHQCFLWCDCLLFTDVSSVQRRLQPVLDLVSQPSPVPIGPNRRPHPRQRQQSEVRTSIWMNTLFSRDTVHSRG